VAVFQINLPISTEANNDDRDLSYRASFSSAGSYLAASSRPRSSKSCGLSTSFVAFNLDISCADKQPHTGVKSDFRGGPSAMDDSDNWPLPDYNPGPRSHLHAFGVIARRFATLEASVSTLCPRIAHRRQIPLEDSPRLNEKDAIKAMKKFIAKHEDQINLRALTENLLDYFDWCQYTRNQLLHAERYPATFGRDDVLYLMKPINKGSSESGHAALSLPELRDIADKTHAGVLQCAHICLFIRYSGVPIEKMDKKYRPFAQSLPEKLIVPARLELELWSS
jgi:hypothetical protein